MSWTGKNDLKTLRVDADFFEIGEKILRFQKYPDTLDGALILGYIYLGKILIRNSESKNGFFDSLPPKSKKGL